MRLIDADALDKMLMDAQAVSKERGGNFRCGVIGSVRENIRMMPTIEQPKWIPINERKPNSCGIYIVARWFIDGCRRKILTDACYFDGSNTWHDDTRVNHSRPYLTDKIVAWMPLPDPPKDGEQE